MGASVWVAVTGPHLLLYCKNGKNLQKGRVLTYR
jgi:hypothetical protein